MMRNRRLRRTVAATLIVIGAVLLWLAPSSLPGVLAFVVGIVLELLGVVLERRGPSR
jgi:uncharacterized membrane protein YccC